MACLKGLIELVLTHVRLTLQADVPFDANEIGASIFMRIEPSGLIGGRTPSLTPRPQLMGSQKQRHVQTSPLHTLSSHGAHFSHSLNPRPSRVRFDHGGFRAAGPLPGALSSARYPPGDHGKGIVGAQMNASMLAAYAWKCGSYLGHNQKPVRTQ